MRVLSPLGSRYHDIRPEDQQELNSMGFPGGIPKERCRCRPAGTKQVVGPLLRGPRVGAASAA